MLQIEEVWEMSVHEFSPSKMYAMYDPSLSPL